MTRITLDTKDFRANDCYALMEADNETLFSIEILNHNKYILGIRAKDHRKIQAVVDKLPVGKIQITNNDIQLNDQPFSTLLKPEQAERAHFRHTIFSLPHSQYAFRGITRQERKYSNVPKAKMGLFADQKLIAVMGGKHTSSNRLFSNGKDIWIETLRSFEPHHWSAVGVFIAATLLSLSKLNLSKLSNEQKKG